MRRALGLPEEAFLILWLGRLSFFDKADLLPLVQVFARLVRDNPARPLLLVVAGTGHPLFGKMVRHYASALGVGDRILLVAPLSPQQRHLFHAAADVFVSPADSLQETFGIMPIEAMACGVPQVVSDWDGYRDTVRHGETGFLIPTYLSRTDGDARLMAGVYDDYKRLDHLCLSQATAIDLEAYQRALQALIVNEDLRHRMAESSRRRAVAEYGWGSVIEAYECLWAELAGIARGMRREPSPHDDYAVPAFLEAFGHYATTILSGDARLAITEAGRRVLRGEEVLPAYGASFGVLSGGLLSSALSVLGGARHPPSLDELDVSLRSEGEGSPERVRSHAMWLLKYGFAQVVE